MSNVECRTNGLRKSNEVVFPYRNNNLDQPYVNKLQFLRFRVCDPKSDKKGRDEVVQRKVAKRNSVEIGRGLNASAQRERETLKLSPASCHKSNKSDFSGRVPPSSLSRAYLNHP